MITKNQCVKKGDEEHFHISGEFYYWGTTRIALFEQIVSCQIHYYSTKHNNLLDICIVLRPQNGDYEFWLDYHYTPEFVRGLILLEQLNIFM